VQRQAKQRPNSGPFSGAARRAKDVFSASAGFGTPFGLTVPIKASKTLSQRFRDERILE
jgi:hypothetical protein